MSLLLCMVVAAAPMPFDEALERANRSPLAVASAQAAETRRAFQSRVSSVPANPTVGLQPGFRHSALGSGPEVMANVSQPLSLGGLSGARHEAMSRELTHDLETARLARHEARLLASEAWLMAWAADGVLREARRELELAKDLAARFERAGKSGAVTKGETAAMRAWVAEAQLAVLASEGEVFQSGVHLNRVLGLDAATPAQVTPELPALVLVDDAALAASLQASERAPEVTRAASLKNAEEAHARELLAGKGTWLQVGAVGGREGTGDVVALATLSVTLPAFDRGEREAAPFEAAAVRAEGERKAALAEARAVRVQATHELEHTRETLDVLAQQLVPASDDAATFVGQRLAGGDATAPEWILARRAALSARSRKVRAESEHALARFRALELVEMTQGVAP